MIIIEKSCLRLFPNILIIYLTFIFLTVRKWKDNIKMNLNEVEWSGMSWIDLAQDRHQWRALVSALIKFLVA
jgi:hypothetical protein